jgi:hypothetical protein
LPEGGKSIRYSVRMNVMRRRVPMTRRTMIRAEDQGYVLPPQTNARIIQQKAARKNINPK